MPRRDGSRALGVVFALAALAIACATSPTGRKQLNLVSDADMDTLGAQSFEQLKQQQPIDHDPKINAYVRCIVDPLAKAARGKTDVTNWEVVVFKDPTPNAFALPGGKIGVQTGILPVAKTPSQLAAVLGHEIGHVIAKHGAERVSQQIAASEGMNVASIFVGGGGMSAVQQQLVLAGLGLGVQVGYLLPYSRTQESEADLIGLDLMAQAGFDPKQSVDLWKNMIQASGGGGPPTWLSTHPQSEDRMKALEAHMNEAMAEYQKTLESGHRPKCTPPS